MKIFGGARSLSLSLSLSFSLSLSLFPLSLSAPTGLLHFDMAEGYCFPYFHSGLHCAGSLSHVLEGSSGCSCTTCMRFSLMFI